MDEVINLADLPEHIRAQIIEERKKVAIKRGLHEIEPRMFQAHFSTKEQQEFGLKIDELIEQYNMLLEAWNKQQSARAGSVTNSNENTRNGK